MNKQKKKTTTSLTDRIIGLKRVGMVLNQSHQKNMYMKLKE